MRKYTVTILFVIVALVTLATISGSQGKDTVTQVSGINLKDSILTSDKMYALENGASWEAVFGSAPENIILTSDKMYALENGASWEAVFGSAP